MLALFSIIFAVLLSAGIILLSLNLVIGTVFSALTVLAGVLCVLCFAGFLLERTRYLMIDDDQINLPRGAEVNGKTSFQRTHVRFETISYIDSKLLKGDRGWLLALTILLNAVPARDTTFYEFKLKDGTQIRFTLCSFGKKAEEEIVSILKQHIKAKANIT